MDIQQFNAVMAARKAVVELEEEVQFHATIKECVRLYRLMLQDAYITAYKTSRRAQPATPYWVFHTDYVEVNVEGDYVSVDCYKHGCMGDPDECVDAFRFDPDLLTLEGRTAVVHAVISKEIERALAHETDAQQERLEEIARLEKQLAILKGTTQ